MTWGVAAVFGGLAMGLVSLAGVGGPARADTYTVGVRALKIENAMETSVLTNSEGLTLYYYSADTRTASHCIGACTSTWRPLISDAPTKDPAIRGEVGVVHTVHGSQVAFNGHPLYTYVDDKAPGTALGYGKGGKWFVATPALGWW